jgi:hypothetical protein
VLRLLGINNVLSLIPGMAKLGRGVAAVGTGILEGMGGGKPPKTKKDEAKEKEGEENAKEDANSEWGYGLDEFIGFAGTKAGPLEGFLKVMHLGA